MFDAIAMNDLIFLIAGLLVAGAATGILAGVFGVGGGILIVPVLYELFRATGVVEEVRMPLAIGSSLAIIIPTSIRSFRAHYAKGAVDLDLLKAWAVPVVLGVIAGTLVARIAPPMLFKSLFIGIATFTCFRLLFARDNWVLKGDMPTGLSLKIYGVVIGLLSSLMGIGGGQLCNVYMMLYRRPCLLYTSPSPRDGLLSRMPSSA